MADNVNNTQQNSTSELQVRREKLNALYESGKNPFEITKYNVTIESASAIKLFEEFSDELKTVFIVSRAHVSNEPAPEGAFTDTESGIAVVVKASSGTKCDRCWYYSDDVKTDSDGQHLCTRCSAIIKKISLS